MLSNEGDLRKRVSTLGGDTATLLRLKTTAERENRKLNQINEDL